MAFLTFVLISFVLFSVIYIMLVTDPSNGELPFYGGIITFSLLCLARLFMLFVNDNSWDSIVIFEFIWFSILLESD